MNKQGISLISMVIAVIVIIIIAYISLYSGDRVPELANRSVFTDEIDEVRTALRNHSC